MKGDHFGDAEVGDPRPADILGILNKDVRWLDVEMPNTGAVNCAESLANLDSQGDRRALVQAMIREGISGLARDPGRQPIP